MEVHIVPILNDNYAYIVQTDNAVAVIDPGEARPIMDYLTEHLFEVDWIINTHKHGDHTSGNVELKDAYDCKLAAPRECDGHIDFTLEDGAVFPLGNLEFRVLLTKGHTAGHVVLFEPNRKILFSGDTLFVMGCGRVFEGSADDMFTSMQRIKSLSLETKIYCGHEYTKANAAFARHILPDNPDIQKRAEDLANFDCTVPTTLAEELKTNPFLLADSPEQFAEYRKAKDRF